MDEDNKYGFGPIAKPRDTNKKNIIKAEVYVIIVVTVLLLIYRVMSTSSNNSIISYSDIYTFTGIVCSIILYQLIRRCCLFAEEYHHIDGRYCGSTKAAIKACLSLAEGKAEIVLVFAFSIAYTIKSWLQTSDESWLFPIIPYVIIKLAASVAVKMCGVTPLSRVEISEMNECDINNVSEGLAWSFYFKYLKKILPQLDNMFQRATGENFQVDGGDICDKVKDKRLFLIIPKDGYCYNTFDEVDDRLRFVDRPMPLLKENRGFGGGERTYKNTLYEVSMENMDSKYAVMEYATPLLSLYDMSVNAKVKFTEENRDQQVVEFYKKLERILADDPECRGKCKLVLTGAGAIKVPPRRKKLADIMWEAINN